jgi:hypothetical protein
MGAENIASSLLDAASGNQRQTTIVCSMFPNWELSVNEPRLQQPKSTYNVEIPVMVRLRL